MDKLNTVVTALLKVFTALLPEAQSRSDLQRLSTKLPWLFALTEENVEWNPAIRQLITTGIAPLVHSQFVLEGKAIVSAVFAGSFKRCALLWNLLFRELKACSYPQRLLLKLEYCQKYQCIETFNSSPLEIKRSLVSENAASITFALDLSVALMQGFLPAELNDLGATMIAFFEEFHQYLPYDSTPIPPTCCQEVLVKLTVTSEPSKHEGVEMVLILTAVLQCVSQYGWHAAIGDIDLKPLLMTLIYSRMAKLSIVSKALLAFMPGSLGVEVLLDKKQLSHIVKQLSITAAIQSTSNEYSLRELMIIFRATTRVHVNSTGLLEEGVEEVLGALMEQDDEIANAIAAEITCRIASGGVNTEEEAMESSSNESNFDTMWGCDSIQQTKDPDGTIVYVDILLHQLAELLLNIKSLTDLSAEDSMTIETLILAVFDIYWQSEGKVKNAVAELIGDKYIQCFIDLDDVVIAIVMRKTATSTTAVTIAYNHLMQEWARRSTYFCEKACAGGLIIPLLIRVQNLTSFLETELHLTILEYRLTVLFYCAHVKMFHFPVFGLSSAIDSLACVLQSPVAHTRLLARLVICCLLPMLQDCHKTLLEMTDEESVLLLIYVAEMNLPGGLDKAKFLMATSILYGDLCPQNASGLLAVAVAEAVVQHIFNLHDNCILESTLCLLWTFCHTPCIVQKLFQMDHLIPELKKIQHTQCSAVSSLAKCTLLNLGCGNLEDSTERYHYACTCLHYERYTECIEQCDHIITTTTSSLHGEVRQMRGKSFARLHQKQFWNIKKENALDVAVPLKSGNAVDQCAKTAKAAVKDLGFALDHGVLDEEGSYLMDIAMLQYIQMKNQLEDCNRCLLCRRRGVELKKSHTCPRFLLKETKKRVKKTLQALGIGDSFDAQDFYSSKGRFVAHTPRTATCPMLCGRCEQVLSQNGEDQFQKNIMPLFYNANDEMQTAKYDSTLYSFCLGIVFRFFVHKLFTVYCNASEIYSLLIACRHHLLSLPVRYSETGPPNPPPVAATLPISPVEVFLMPSPHTLHIESSQLYYLAVSMNSNFGSWCINIPLSTEPKTKVNVCHALVVRLGPCSIVVPFSPARDGSLDANCLVNPNGGNYRVLPDVRRWEIMPSGLLQVFVWFAHEFEQQCQQIVAGMKTSQKDSKKADALIGSLTLVASKLPHQPIDANSLQLLPPKEEELISIFLSKSLVPAKMLPKSFDVITSPCQVILKEGYKLLYHIHSEQENATYFFAGCPQDLTYGKLVVIMKYKKVNENFERVESVNIHIRENDSSSMCVTGFLLEPATETLQKTQHSRHRIVSEGIKKGVNTIVQKSGSIKAFLHHARLQMRMKINPCLDKRCSSNGCWYCMDRCHVCMEPADQAYTSIVQAKKRRLMFSHCSAECKTIVENVSQLSTELQPLKQVDNKCLILASIMGCLASVLSTHTIVQVNICISVERSSIMYGRPYATVQLHTQEQNVLFSVYLSEDLSPTQPADDFPAAFPFQMLIESNLLPDIFRTSLHPLGVFSISHLLRDATKVDITLAEMFSISCSSYESKFCWEELVAFLNSKISQEVSLKRWMVDQLIFVCDDNKELLEMSLSESLPEVSTFLIPSSKACCTLLLAYFQLTCLLWRRVLEGNNGSLFQKIIYVTHITIKLYEQSPLHVQKHITDAFCSSAQTLLLCGQIALIAIKGGLPLNIHESAVQLLLLAHKFIAVVRTSSEALKSIQVRHLNQELKGIKHDDVQRLTEVSAVAQQFLVTSMLKSHICDDGSVEAISIKPFLNSFSIFASIMAKAVAVGLLQCSIQAEIVASDTEMTEEEIDFLVVIIHGFTEDSLKRRYLFYLILQALTLLCSQPVNADQFARHNNIVTELEALVEYADELEDPNIIANVLRKIDIDGGVKNTTETAGTFELLPGAEIPEIDICLDVEQGLCQTAEKLLMIIHEFYSIYLESEHVHESYSCTVSSAAQLLCDLHQTMDSEKEEIAQFVSQNTSIVIMLSLAVSRHSKSWLCCFKGIHTRGAIESLLVTWTDCSQDFCQAVAGSEILTSIASTLHWALENESDNVSLQNQLLIIYNVARKCPKQTAFELKQLTCLQPLLNCSSLHIRVISKSIVAFLADYMDISDLATISLTCDEVKYFADGFADFINSRYISTDIYKPQLSIEKLLFCFQKLSSLPCSKSCCGLPCLLDALLALSLHDEKTIAKTALEVLWNIGMEPTVALAILCHENVVYTLQKMSAFNTEFAEFARSILWMLGYGNTEDIIGCFDFASACYKFGKYKEAISWCDHVLDMATTMHPIVSRVKSCKGKALAQIYLHKQLQRLQGSDQWTMLGYDGNSEIAETVIPSFLGSHPSAIDNELLHQLCFADLQNWKSLCSQGQQAIKLLGEVLDSGELDEQGFELLDWVMMDYCRESGRANDCKRCLLCRKIRELVPFTLRSTPTEGNSLTSESILSLHSFMHFDQLQNILMFCKECDSILFTYSDNQVQSLLNEKKGTYGKPITYERVFYLHLIAKFAQRLPLVYTGYCSNWKDIYNTFAACRQILLSHDIYNSTKYFPKIYLFNNPNTWYVLTDSEFCSFNSSRNVTAMIPRKPSIGKRGSANEFQFLMMHTDGCTIILEFYSEKKECVQFPSQYLINPAGGSYPLPHVSERWEAFPQEVIQAFHDLALADERRNVCQHILRLEGTDFSTAQKRSTRFWLPKKLSLSFLPEGFSLEVDSDAIRNITLPRGHKIIYHTHDQDKNLTIFLAYATNSMCQEKQFYFIFTCKLHNYFTAAGMFLSGVTTELTASSNPVMFPFSVSFPVEEVAMVQPLFLQKLPPMLLFMLLKQMLVNYGNFGFEAVSTYEDVTRNANLPFSVDKRCSPEGCWYCHHRCHSCMKPASVGYTWKDGDSGQLLYHCSNRCYSMYTGDIPESTILDVKVGEIQDVPVHGANLLLSATVLLENGRSMNSVVSTQVAISHGSTGVPEGVVYVITRVKKIENSTLPIAFFIQHDLTPVKNVWEPPTPEFKHIVATMMQMVRETDLLRENLQPAFKALGCDDLTSFLEQKFPHLHISFMDLSGDIYLWPPNSGQVKSLMGKGGGSDSAQNGTVWY